MSVLQSGLSRQEPEPQAGRRKDTWTENLAQVDSIPLYAGEMSAQLISARAESKADQPYSLWLCACSELLHVLNREP
jgi:hypothetical protein